MFSLAISFFCGKNRLATNSALLFVYKPNPNPNSGKFHTQKNPQKNIHTSKFSHTVYVTKIDREFQADTYFPNLDQMEDWKMTEEGEEQTCFDLEFAFTKYERC